MEPSSQHFANRTISGQLFEYGKQLLPGGVNSPGRAFTEVNVPPLFIKSGDGKYIFDEDGNRYLDFICGLGPAFLGHGHPEVKAAVSRQFASGTVFGAPTKLEYQLADTILASSQYLDQIRFTCSGTEATMTALRIARSATGKPSVLKFNGGYHGHSDMLISGGVKQHMKAENGVLIRNGIEPAIQANTYLAEYNNIESVLEAVRVSKGAIGSIIIEPVPSNIGVIPPDPAFLAALRGIADSHGMVLIFDEVVSGFRHRFGPVADELGVRPDLITFGKIIGGGLPVGAFGGSEELMSLLVERGGVFQGGTFAGSPLVMAAGLAQLDIVKRKDVPGQTKALAERLCGQLQERFRAIGLPYSAQFYGSLVTPILVQNKPRLTCNVDMEKQDKSLFQAIYNILLEAGIALAPTIEEPIFISACHTEQDIDMLAETFVNATALYVNNINQSL